MSTAPDPAASGPAHPAGSSGSSARATRRHSGADDDERTYDALGPIGGGDDVYTNVISRLLAGPLIFGLIGFGLDRWLHTAFFLPVGLIGGMALAIYVIWLRYGTAVAPAHPVSRTNPPHEETQ